MMDIIIKGIRNSIFEGDLVGVLYKNIFGGLHIVNNDEETIDIIHKQKIITHTRIVHIWKLLHIFIT